MKSGQILTFSDGLPKLKQFPKPAKVLVTVLILTMATAMIGALGQIVIHDIIPIFFSDTPIAGHPGGTMSTPAHSSQANHSEHGSLGRGDLLSDDTVDTKPAASKQFFQTEQFVWALKWTHIHLFGMNMIFIFMGAIVLFLDLSTRIRTWLIFMPFAGVVLDIASLWLKIYVSPVFFWLHIPGGALFGAIFVFVSLRALSEMWRENGSLGHALSYNNR
jgi:hypothetical protein